jgi:thiol-disulfide isomerase/thioredoxin
MILLHNHNDLEKLLCSRRPIDESFFGKYDPWVAICFSAKWCGPCQKINKKVLVNSTPEIKWYSVDVDINKISLGYCGLYKIPSFVIIKNGTFLDRKEGTSSLADIILWLQKNEAPIDI